MREDLKIATEKLTALLRLQSYPVGVKLFKKKEDVQPIFRRPASKVNLCQLIALARQDGLLVAGGAENMVCIAGAAFLGMVKIPDRLASGELSFSHHLNIRAAARKVESIPALKEAHEAICFFPLGKTTQEPDIVLVYGNAAQMMRLIQASIYHDGIPLEVIATAEFACSYSIAYPIIKNKPHLTIPCYGERKYAQVMDDELVFSVPFDLLDNVIEGLIQTHKKGVRLPISHQVDYFPSMSERWQVTKKDIM